MIDAQKQFEGQSQQAVLKQSSKVVSEYYAQYQEITRKIRQQYQQHQQQNSNRKLGHTIIDSKDFMIEVKCQIQSKQIYNYSVNIRGSVFNILVLFIKQNSPLSKIKADQEGAHGSVYTFSLHDCQIAIKSYNLECNVGWHTFIQSQKLHRIVKEYFISCLSSQMQSGPCIKNWLGFDLVVFNNRIQFAMEKCEPINQFSENDYESLLLSLTKLHSRNIVHNDITNNNIMYSPTYKKHVFIDYGFSDIIEEQVGFKTFSRFQGTANFVSKQMLVLFSVEDKQDYVDLYYNDLVCLQNSSEQIKNKIEMNQLKALNLISDSLIEFDNKIDSEVHNKEKYQFFYLLLYFWYCMYEEPSQVEKLLRYKDQLLIKHFPRQILRIFSKRLPSKLYEQILFTQLYCLRNLDQYVDLCKTVRIRKISAFKSHRFILQSFISVEDVSSDQINFIKEELGIDQIDEQNTKLFFKQLHKYTLRKDFYQSCSEKIIFYVIVFQQLRFDSGMIRLMERKQLIADFFLSLVGEENNTQDPVFSIRRTFKYILRQMIERPSSDYNCEFISHLIAQAMITETDILEEIEILSQQFITDKYSLQMKINFISIFFYSLRYMDLKYYFLNPQLTQRIEISLKNGINIIRQNLQRPSQKQMRRYQYKSQSYNIAYIISVLFGDIKYNWDTMTSLQHKIHQIKNKNIKTKLIKFLLYYSFQLLKNSQNHFKREAIIQQYILSFSESEQMKKCETFIEELYWRYKFAIESRNANERVLILEIIHKFINYFPLYQCLINFLQIFYSNILNFKEKDTFIQTINKFYDGCFKKKRIHLFLIELKNLVEIIDQDQRFQQIRSEVIPMIIGGWIIQIQRQVHLFIQMTQDEKEPQSFMLENTSIEFSFIVAKNALSLADQQKGKQLFDKLHVILRDLNSKLLERKAKKGLSIYTSYLFYQLNKCYMVRLNQYITVYAFLQYLKNQLSLIEILPNNTKIQIVYVVFQTLDFFQRNRALQNSKQISEERRYLQQIVIYFWKYCAIFDQWGVYFQMKKGSAIKATISTFVSTKSLNFTYNIYDLLKKINEYLVFNPTKNHIKNFQYNISLLYLQYPQIFSSSIIKYFNCSTTWHTRFALLYFALSLYQEKDEKQQLKLLTRIAKEIFLHSWESRQLIQFLCIKKALKMKKLLMDNPRKRRFVIRKYIIILKPQHGKYYGFDKESYVNKIISLHKLKRIKEGSFRKQLREKVLN